MLRQGVLSAIALVVAAMCFLAVVYAVGSPSAWQTQGVPTIQKMVDMAPNTLPDSTNYDCTPATVRYYLTTTMQNDCLTPTALGQASASGIILNGASEMIPVVPPAPFSGLQAVPNQGMFVTTTTAPVYGMYLHMYKSIYDKLPLLPQYVNGSFKMVLTANPDYSLHDASGKLTPTNPAALAYSPNGSWMVVDLIGSGMVRINMATFEIKPFAPSLQQAGDLSSKSAQLTISNDGQTVVVKPNGLSELDVYDLSNCSATLPIAPSAVPCPVHNYWNDVASQLTGFKQIYQPRFVNPTQISFTAVYDFAPGNFKVAKYVMTAPGVSPTGIEYLGMGDSFASGEGAFSYVAGTDTNDNHCHLSSKSYAYIISSQLFTSGHAVSCSGATTNDIVGDSRTYKGQTLSKIEVQNRSDTFIGSVQQTFTPGYLIQSEFIDQYKPEAITLSIGGNNVGFDSILTTCVSPASWPKACYPTYEDRQELNQKVASIFDTLVATYKSVLRPGKRVYVVGYPQIAVTGGSCASNVHLETSEIEMATDFINYFNATIQRAADKAGVRYVDISDAFAGHRLCEASPDQVAVNGFTSGTDIGLGSFTFIGKESYHPNALGHELLAATIRARTNNLTMPMPGGNTSLSAPGLPVDQHNLPKTGRALNALVFDDGLAPDTLVPGQNLTLQESLLKPSSTYRVNVGGVQIGTATTDAQGSLSYSAQLPASLPAGFGPVTLDGSNPLGQPMQVTKTVYIAASATDEDGDGIANTADSCPLLPNANQDIDQDGVDDACDPLIGLPPPLKLTRLQGSVYLTQNSITLTRP